MNNILDTLASERWLMIIYLSGLWSRQCLRHRPLPRQQRPQPGRQRCKVRIGACAALGRRLHGRHSLLQRCQLLQCRAEHCLPAARQRLYTTQQGQLKSTLLQSKTKRDRQSG